MLAHLPFLPAMAAKYVYRFPNKGGAEDLVKAQHYLWRAMSDPVWEGVADDSLKTYLTLLADDLFEGRPGERAIMLAILRGRSKDALAGTAHLAEAAYGLTPLEDWRALGGTHYRMRHTDLQPWDFLAYLPYLPGAAGKYLCRHVAKGGAEDFDKCLHYIERAMEPPVWAGMGNHRDLAAVEELMERVLADQVPEAEQSIVRQIVTGYLQAAAQATAELRDVRYPLDVSETPLQHPRVLPLVAELKPVRRADMELPGYLERWILSPIEGDEPRRALHHFLGIDWRGLHNHPSGFSVEVLSGGYTALEYDPRISNRVRQVRHGKGDTYAMRGGNHPAPGYHAIMEIEPDTYTLVQMEAKSSSWGYLVRRDMSMLAAGDVVGDDVQVVPFEAYHRLHPGPEPIFRNGYRPRSYFRDDANAKAI